MVSVKDILTIDYFKHNFDKSDREIANEVGYSITTVRKYRKIYEEESGEIIIAEEKKEESKIEEKESPKVEEKEIEKITKEVKSKIEVVIPKVEKKVEVPKKATAKFEAAISVTGNEKESKVEKMLKNLKDIKMPKVEVITPKVKEEGKIIRVSPKPVGGVQPPQTNGNYAPLESRSVEDRLRTSSKAVIMNNLVKGQKGSKRGRFTFG